MNQDVPRAGVGVVVTLEDAAVVEPARDVERLAAADPANSAADVQADQVDTASRHEPERDGGTEPVASVLERIADTVKRGAVHDNVAVQTGGNLGRHPSHLLCYVDGSPTLLVASS